MTRKTKITARGSDREFMTVILGASFLMVVAFAGFGAELMHRAGNRPAWVAVQSVTTTQLASR